MTLSSILNFFQVHWKEGTVLCTVMTYSDNHAVTFEWCSSPPQLTDTLVTEVLKPSLYMGISEFVKNPDAQVISEILTYFTQSVALKVPHDSQGQARLRIWCEECLPDVKDSQDPGHPGYVAPPSASLASVRPCSLPIPICHHAWMFPWERWQGV